MKQTQNWLLTELAPSKRYSRLRYAMVRFQSTVSALRRALKSGNRRGNGGYQICHQPHRQHRGEGFSA